MSQLGHHPCYHFIARNRCNRELQWPYCQLAEQCSPETMTVSKEKSESCPKPDRTSAAERGKFSSIKNFMRGRVRKETPQTSPGGKQTQRLTKWPLRKDPDNLP